MEKDSWVLNCLQHELLIEGNCIPFSKVEREVRSLLSKKRTHSESVRLAILHQAMIDHLITIKDLQKQVDSSQTYLNRILSWWYPDTTSDTSTSSKRSSSGASVIVSYGFVEPKRRENSNRITKKKSIRAKSRHHKNHSNKRDNSTKRKAQGRRK